MHQRELLQELEGLNFEDLLLLWIEAKTGREQDLHSVISSHDLAAIQELGESLDTLVNDLK